METRFPVLLHAPLYTALQKLPVPARARFRHLAEKLASGRWSGGTRVKKLKGCDKPVFEARHDRGDRVLFTLSSSASTEGAARLATFVQVWDLVPHDRVQAAAVRINRSAEAEFLDFAELESELVTEPPPHPTARFGALPPAEPGAEPGVVDLMLAPADLSVPRHEEIAGGVRWYVLPERLLVREDEWQKLLDRGGTELELKLTAEQYAVARAPGPVLLSGSAGSGKTTIAIHRLAAAAFGPAPGRALYLTYSPWLVDHARRLYQDLLAGRGPGGGMDPEFLTVPQLYRALVSRAGERPPERILDYPDFERWYARSFRREDSALAWEEIRSIVKGACLDPLQPMLARGDYEALGRKRAPLFAGERGRLYDVARRWQAFLLETGHTDEIDFCRRALARLDGDAAFDLILCDEAQDLAEVQVELLMRLHRGSALDGLYLAGDPQQVINPSGFRWAEVRTAIRERFLPAGRPTPELWTLRRNFRSVRGLVELANEVLALKRDRTGRSDGDFWEDSEVLGPAPLRVEGDEQELLLAIRGFGPRCAVVAGSAEQAERLQKLLETSRVFTVPEAKGLEFEAVVLWGALAASPRPFTLLLDPATDLREDSTCRRALHHLYVALTRARRHLAVYEPPGAPPLWTSDRFAARLDAGSPDSVARLFVRSATAEEWMAEGEYFLARGRARQAAECFRRGGDERRESECLATHAEQVGDFRTAALRWHALGLDAKAAPCFERAGDHAEAERLFAALGDVQAGLRCRARRTEGEGDWRAAAAAWGSLASWQDAARCWSNAGERRQQLRCLASGDEARGDHRRAAERFEEARDWDRAALCWQNAGALPAMARAQALAHEQARRFEAAAEAWDRAGEPVRASRARATSAEREGDHARAARAWEEAGEFQAAVRAWHRAGQSTQVLRLEVRRDLAEGRYVRAAEAFEEMHDLPGAADAWQRAAAAGQGPRKTMPLPLPKAARSAWTKGGARAKHAAKPARARRGSRPPAAVLHDAATRARACAVTAAEAAGDFAQAETIWTALGDPSQALRCRVIYLERSGRVSDAAETLEEKGLLEAAADAWTRAGDRRAAGRCQARALEEHHHYEAAADIWTEIERPRDAVRCRGLRLFQQLEFEQAAAAFREAGERDRAFQASFRARQMAGDWKGLRQLVRESGARELLRRIDQDRAAVMTEGMMLAEEKRKRAAHALRVTRQTAQGALFPGAPAKDRTAGASLGHAGKAALLRGADTKMLVAAVTMRPGLTCEFLRGATGIPDARIKALLRDLVAGGRLVKTGKTRGTRYWLPEVGRGPGD